MRHHLDQQGPSDQPGDCIERQLAKLGGSIHPISGHRDQMLQRASESVVRSRSKLRTAQVAIAMSVLLIVISPIIGALTRVKVSSPPTADQANAEALQHARESQLSFDWALVDVFNRFRESKRVKH
jgi:hypothetical protein